MQRRDAEGKHETRTRVEERERERREKEGKGSRPKEQESEACGRDGRDKRGYPLGRHAAGHLGSWVPLKNSDSRRSARLTEPATRTRRVAFMRIRVLAAIRRNGPLPRTSSWTTRVRWKRCEGGVRWVSYPDAPGRRAIVRPAAGCNARASTLREEP